MKIKYPAIVIALTVFSLALPSVSFGQGMMASPAAVQAGDDHTGREEAQGKAVWTKLQAKQITCAALTDADFELLGEYFMGQIAGNAHEAMNALMTQMMGAAGEEQMHVALGKRASNCEPNAALPQNMMGMFGPSGAGGSGAGMMGGYGFGSNMMGQAWGSVWSAWGIAYWITLVLLWVLMASASAYLIKRLRK